MYGSFYAVFSYVWSYGDMKDNTKDANNLNAPVGENENEENELVNNETANELENEKSHNNDADERADSSLDLVEAEIVMNALDYTMYESDGGLAKLVGMKEEDGLITLAVKLEGELRNIATEFEPSWRLITDAGNVYENYDIAIRYDENAAYVVFNIKGGQQGEKIERIDYYLETVEYTTEEKEFEKIIIADEMEAGEVVVPGIAAYRSYLDEPIVLEDDEKTIEMKEMFYDSSENDLDLVMDVTYHSDEEVKTTSYIYNYETRTMDSKEISEEFFEGIVKEISVSYRIERMSEHTSMFKLVLFDHAMDIDLFADGASRNSIELVEQTEASIAHQLPYSEEGYLNTKYLFTPGFPTIMKDMKGKEYFDDVFSLEGGINGIYYDYEQYRIGYYRFLTDDYNRFEATLTFRDIKDHVGDVAVYFIGDDFEASEEEDSLKHFKGKVLEEVIVKEDSTPVEVSIDLEGTSVLTMYTQSNATSFDTNMSEIIVSKGLLKK